MKETQHNTIRALLLSAVFLGLVSSLTLPGVSVGEVNAAPMPLPATTVVISEFRVRGPNGGNDEFIELYNPTITQIDIGDWIIRGSNSSGVQSDKVIVNTGVILDPGEHYLLTNSNSSGGPYSGSIPGDQTYGSGIADDGGIALVLDNGTTIVDQVGMTGCAAGCYYESSPVMNLGTSNQNRGYERDLGGANGSCQDSDDNSADFALRTPSDPQNFSSTPIVCTVVTNITSTNLDGVYAAGAGIVVTITFNRVVNVTGAPTLLLETGTIDRNAAYTSGDGTDTLAFTYTVVAGDVSIDLDYVNANSLALNGGTITGSTGDALLILPAPGAVGSLGANKALVIDNGIPPTVTVDQAALQVDPATALPVNFELVFSEPINASTFNASDITQGGTAPVTTWNILDSGDHMNFTLSAAVVPGNGTLIPSIAANQVIDGAGNNNAASTSTDNQVTYTDVTAPTVTVNQASGQPDPTSAFPIDFAVAFSEPINATTFTTADVTQNGSATGVTWSLANSGDDRNFTLSATALTGSGTLTPSIAANQVTDGAGNNNTASTSTDNTVTHTPACTTTTVTTPLTLVINEVAWAGTAANSGDEWIELYNPAGGVGCIVLTGWVLRTEDGTPTINLTGTIQEDGYFLLERTDDLTISNITADQIFTDALLDSGEKMFLENNGIRVDTANIDGGAWPAGSTASYRSMERLMRSGVIVADSPATWLTNVGTVRNGLDGNGNPINGTPRARNWAATVTPTPSRTPVPTRTPTRRPTTIPVGRPVINEFLARPGFDWNQDGNVDVFDEFIEVMNYGPVDINMSGWRLDDGENLGSSPFVLPDITLKPGERAVYYGLETNILLSDGGDAVRLLSPEGKIYDSFTYSIAKVEDESTCRLPDGNGSWYKDCTPTPSLANTREGMVPSMPQGEAFQSPVCSLPDTLPIAFLFAECRGYGANIWRAMFWDATGWDGERFVPENMSKWHSFVE